MRLSVIHGILSFLPLLFTGTASSQEAPTQYKISLRLLMEKTPPLKLELLTKSGRKQSLSQLASDGRSEIFLEIFPQKWEERNKPSLLLEIKVKKIVDGNTQFEAETQLYTQENLESEVQLGSKENECKIFIFAKKTP